MINLELQNFSTSISTSISNDIQIVFFVNKCYNQKIFEILSISHHYWKRIEKRMDGITEDLMNLNKVLESQCSDHYNLVQLFSKISGYHDKKIFLINFDEIMYLRADGDYTDIVTKKGVVYKSKLSLKKLTYRLKGTSFYRCHRSFLVNVEKIKEIVPSFNYTFELVFNNCKDRVPVGRKYLKEFKDLVGI